MLYLTTTSCISGGLVLTLEYGLDPLLHGNKEALLGCNTNSRQPLALGDLTGDGIIGSKLTAPDLRHGNPRLQTIAQ